MANTKITRATALLMRFKAMCSQREHHKRLRFAELIWLLPSKRRRGEERTWKTEIKENARDESRCTGRKTERTRALVLCVCVDACVYVSACVRACERKSERANEREGGGERIKGRRREKEEGERERKGVGARRDRRVGSEVNLSVDESMVRAKVMSCRVTTSESEKTGHYIIIGNTHLCW